MNSYERREERLNEQINTIYSQVENYMKSNQRMQGEMYDFDSQSERYQKLLEENHTLKNTLNRARSTYNDRQESIVRDRVDSDNHYQQVETYVDDECDEDDGDGEDDNDESENAQRFAELNAQILRINQAIIDINEKLDYKLELPYKSYDLISLSDLSRRPQMLWSSSNYVRQYPHSDSLPLFYKSKIFLTRNMPLYDQDLAEEMVEIFKLYGGQALTMDIVNCYEAAKIVAEGIVSGSYRERRLRAIGIIRNGDYRSYSKHEIKLTAEAEKIVAINDDLCDDEIFQAARIMNEYVFKTNSRRRSVIEFVQAI